MGYKLINPEYLDSIAGDDHQIIIEIVNMFKEQVSETLQEMQTLHTKKDYRLLGMLAHKAKSSVAIMGMNDLAVMLKTFELSAKEGKDTELYRTYIKRFEEETKAAIIELDEMVSNLPKKSL